jgi:MEMO1 family protein
MRRQPAVAGMFYSRDPDQLRAEIEHAFLGKLGPGALPSVSPERVGNVLGIISPHAGYMYSGFAAAHAFSALAKDGMPEVAVIIGPNHRGMGVPLAIVEKGFWDTPLGEIAIDEGVSASLLRDCRYVQADASAHASEHSLEVQAPFLQYLAQGKTRIVPIAVGIGPRDAASVVAELGACIAAAVNGADAVIIASTDMTHYESKSSAASKDALAINALESLDSGRLLEVVVGAGITMCGAVPAAIAVEACRRMGAGKAELLTYYTSGDVTGDTSQVVGYAAMKITRA